MKNKLTSIILFATFLMYPFTSSAEESQSKTYFNAGMMDLSMDTLNDLKGTGITIDDEASVLSLGVGNGLGFDFLTGPSSTKYGASIKITF